METSSGHKNIFVLAYNERHSADLFQIPDVNRFQFHHLLHSEHVVYQDNYNINENLEAVWN